MAIKSSFAIVDVTEGRVKLDVSKLPLEQVLALAGASSAAELGEVDEAGGEGQ